MALTTEQTDLINRTLSDLGRLATGDMAADVSAALEDLVVLLNQNSSEGAVPIEYDPTVGYTPILGETLLSRIEAFRNDEDGAFPSLERWSWTGLASQRLAAPEYDYLPQILRDEPRRLIRLINEGTDIIAALDVAHESGVLIPTDVPDPGIADVPEDGEPEDGLETGDSDLDVEGEGAVEDAPAEEPEGDQPVEDEPSAESEEGELNDDQPEATPPPEPPQMPTGIAVEIVEEVLKDLAPELNERLDSVSERFNGASGIMGEGGFLAGLAEAFMGSMIPEARITEIQNVDGIFDLRSQAALQGLMTVLSHQNLMAIPGENPHLYTPQKGAFIMANYERFMNDTLRPQMSEEAYNDLREQLSPEVVEGLVQALNRLHEEGLISQELLINPEGAAAEIPDETIRHFQERVTLPEEGSTAYASLEFHGILGVSGLEETNPDMLRILDGFTREFTGSYGLAELMPDLALPDLMGDVDGSLSAEDRLAEFYAAARRTHTGSDAEMSADLIVLLDTVMLLPFGESEYRDEFREAMREGIIAAGNERDHEAAGRIFAESVTSSAQALRDEYGPPQYVAFANIDVPRARPGLTNLNIVSGGQSFNGEDIAQAIDDYNLTVADADNRRLGQSDEWYRQAFVTFTDDDGQFYVALEDDETRMFTIEPINSDLLREMYAEPTPTLEEFDAKIQRMREADPAFALLVNENGDIEMGVNSYDQLMQVLSNPQNSYSLSDLSERYGLQAQEIHEENARLDAEEEAAREPMPLAENSARDGTDRSVPELPDHVTADTLLSLREYVRTNQLPASPHLLHSRDPDIALLDSHSSIGLPIGMTPHDEIPSGSNLVIRRVDMLDPVQADRPMIAYYDESSNRVQVIEVPDVILDHDARNQLMRDATSMDSLEFFERVRDDYPALHEIVQAYRSGAAEARQNDPADNHMRLNDEPATLTDYWGFNADLRRILTELEGDLGGRNYTLSGDSPSPLRGEFGGAGAASPPEPEAPVTFEDAASELTGQPRGDEPAPVVLPEPFEDLTND